MDEDNGVVETTADMQTMSVTPQVTLKWRPDPHWSAGDQAQLLRLLFAPRLAENDESR